ncbi:MULTISPECIES: rhodanese-like domain-containing protein [Gordonia]|uniref:Rhodanese domain-containing protein n=2 Tax=Gordonia TaxID=2053 RepID=L7LPI5_9ACTN|nr:MULTISPECIES: rhodanese-like domain-containing protein [Gordonia]AUH70067.1 rhodanese-like domain-containing protein [Gordonia sp. YC-JH1]KJR06250.1 sulfurtransferase [Gordonia sihwensis]KXT56153.1 sulfurtransferase [Gordonia sp. QH-12]MBY4570460.1 sulfurtransferase [Gordonia sihwensis]WFN95079.1 rhodanese-like domain-containing protein [Gordonia sihwensis]
MDEIETVAVTDLPDDFSDVTDKVLLDVRENYEWEEAHVRGALHIPLDDVPARIDEIDLDSELLVICRTSGRSFRLLQYLAMRGIDGTCVEGGMVAWQAADKPVDTGTEGMYGSGDA